MVKCSRCENADTFFECGLCKTNFCNECAHAYQCDFCKKNICRKCSELSTTEERCMTLRNRILKFLCSECKNAPNYQQLRQSNMQLTKDNAALQKQLENWNIIKNKITLLEDRYTKLQDLLETNIATIVKNAVTTEIMHMRQEVNNLKESNIDLIKLMEGMTHTHSNNMPSYRDAATKKIHNLMSKSNTKLLEETTVISTNTGVAQKEINISVNEEKDTPANNRNQEPQWTIQTRRRKKPQVGSAEIIEGEGNEFEGSEQKNEQKKNKKIWLFISNAKNKVTKEVVLQYISKKANTDVKNIYVKAIEPIKKIENNNCFMIGIDPSLQEMVYNSKFWPSGIVYDRFDFKKGRRFLDDPKYTIHKSSEPNSVPTSVKEDQVVLISRDKKELTEMQNNFLSQKE